MSYKFTTAVTIKSAVLPTRVGSHRRIRNRVQTSLKVNIDTLNTTTQLGKLKVKKRVKTNPVIVDNSSPSGKPKVVDTSVDLEYHGHKEEMDRLAEDWIALVLKQVMKRSS